MFSDVSQRVSNFLERLNEKPLPKFSLADLPGFPFKEYQSNMDRYSDLEAWYSGSKLDETVEQEGKQVELYPVHVNPIPGAVEKHTHFLFGQVSEDDRPLVNARIIPNNKDDETERQSAEDAENTLAQVWWESNGRSIQWENGAIAQIYGGCVFHVVYDPKDLLRTVPIRIDNVHPKYFVGVPDSSNLWRLHEAWIIQPISHLESSLEYGVTIPTYDEPWLIQHYTEATYEVFVNTTPARHLVDGEWVPFAGNNEWGFIPIIYIPHIRTTGYYGLDLIKGVEGLVKEINLRTADFGDAVTVDAHAYVGMRNINGAPTIMQVAPGLYAVNVGSNPNITGQESEPDIFEIRKQMASDPMKDLVDLLYSMFRRQASIPAVVDGEDEGSQRSGLTLAMRMISLTSHTEAERVFWTTGLTLLNRMVLRMLQTQGEAGITDEQIGMRLKLEWAPILPRDREMVVNEAVALMAAKLGSPERLLEELGVDDVNEEKKLILKFVDELLKIETKYQMQIAEQQAEAMQQQQQARFGQSKTQPAKKGVPGSSLSAQSATKE